MIQVIKNDYTKLFYSCLMVLCFSSSCLEGFAQKSRSGQIMEAKQELSKIKNNGLVVTFNTKQPLIDHFRSAGEETKAQKIENEVKEYNQRITEYFKETYTYGPVYFTDVATLQSATESGKELVVKNREGENVIVNPDEVLFLNTKRVYLDTYHANLRGFGVHDKNFKFLKRPFPFFTKFGFWNRLMEKDERITITSMQEKFAKLESPM